MKTVRVEWKETVYFYADVSVSDVVNHVRETEGTDIDLTDTEAVAGAAARVAAENGREQICDGDGIEEPCLLLIDGEIKPGCRNYKVSQ